MAKTSTTSKNKVPKVTNSVGRPTNRAIINAKIAASMTKLSDEIVHKLEEVFAIDGTVEEACFYAGIGRSTYYEWIKENPELADRFEALRNKPVLKARETVIKSINTPEGARWYLERKRKAEFGARAEESAGLKQGGGNIYNFFISPELQSEVRAMEDKIKEALVQPRNVNP